MVRECVPLALMALCPGCSLILDFSDSAAPKDAAIDAVYTQEQCDYKEPNESVTEAQMVVAGDMGPAAICAAAAGTPEDHDFYKFTVATTPFTVSVNFMNRAGGDLDLKVYKADGTLLGQSRGFGDTESITCPGSAPACPAVTAGDYVLEVFPAVAGAVNTYTFTFSQ